ncbi:MAG: hypothetical protein JWR06_2388 [Jatrophihabitans sp.]|nr:hypothetical protein [Jatrophihabitans sp.]
MIGSLSAAAAVLLAVSGLAKLRSPAPAAAMITTLLPATRRHRSLWTVAVRAGGTVEVTVGVLVVAVGGRLPAVLLGACYLVFAAVALRLASRAQDTSCGCFGRAASPVGVAHVALDVVCLAVAVIAVMRPVPTGAGLFDHGAVMSATACGQVVLLAWLGYLAITALPALASARRLEAAQ